MLTYINMSLPGGIQSHQTYIYENDSQRAESLKNTTAFSYQAVGDSNGNFNYNNGIVRWNKDALSASLTPGRRYELNESFIMMPCGVMVSAGTNTCFGTYDDSGANPKSSYDDRFIYTCALKGYQHLVHSLKLTMGGLTVLNSANLHNVYLNEHLKSYSDEDVKVLGDITNTQLDDYESYELDNAVLEKNNRTFVASTDYLRSVNKAHIKRMKRANKNLVKRDSCYSSFGSGTINNQNESGLIAIIDQNGDMVDPSNVTTVIKHLIFQWNVIIPLAKLSSFFQNYPSVNSIPDMTLDITTNMSRNSKYTVTYSKTAAGGVYAEKSVSVSQSIGETCPIMLSQAIAPGTAGIGMVLTNMKGQGALDVDMSVSMVPFIGYYTPDSFSGSITNVNSFPSPIAPVRIFLATGKYTENLELSIASQMNSHLVSYREHSVDTSLEHKSGGSIINHRVSFTSTRLRKLFILPFLSESSLATSVNPRYSPLSSAPTTTSICRLTNFQVQMSNAAIFENHLMSTQDFFMNGALMSMGKFNGNSLTSELFSGQVSMDAFKYCYNTYTIDLERYDSVAEDDLSKGLNLSFTIDSDPSKKFSILIISEHESLLNVERYTGKAVTGKSV